MSSLLDEVVEAHGGLGRWNTLSDLVTEIQMEGHICPPPASSNEIPPRRAFFSLRQQRIVFLTDISGDYIMVEPDLVSFLARPGGQPKIFPVSERTPWVTCSEGNLDLPRTAFVLGFAIRHCVTAPFLYTSPGFTVEEIEPWHEKDETWRVVRIGFPPELEVPSRVQYAYYGADRLLRRTRYTPGRAEGTGCADYASCYQEINGILLPLTHEIVSCDAAGQELPGEPLARIRLQNPFFSE
ncbi:hypothetical protein SAMN05421819_3977 [Bryocella elongata]|uniref:Uncharacterized protein n=1 Tax=Bryocella elongata TaxID=863522 RepID=A0A1H6BRY4_9BACT|nr:hypothetical protein SAMN05421819_3977 [Bryocella elongata]